MAFSFFLFFSFLGSSSLKAASAHTVGGGRQWPWEGVGRELQKWGDKSCFSQWSSSWEVLFEVETRRSLMRFRRGSPPSHSLELSVRPFRARLAGLWGELRQRCPWRKETVVGQGSDWVWSWELDKRLDWKHRTCRNSIDNLISAWWLPWWRNRTHTYLNAVIPSSQSLHRQIYIKMFTWGSVLWHFTACLKLDPCPRNFMEGSFNLSSPKPIKPQALYLVQLFSSWF